MDAATGQEENESGVYLADVKSNTTMGNIDKVDYFEHQNHRGLEVFWAPDSSYCVVENDGRYGADTISILEIKDSTFVQTGTRDTTQKPPDPPLPQQPPAPHPPAPPSPPPPPPTAPHPRPR